MPPDYIYVDSFGPESTVIDVGCGSEAEFAQYLISHRGVRAFGVDPTRKHRPQLEAIAHRNHRFIHLPLAVAASAGTLTFHESVENESGSLLNSHKNVTHDCIRSYDVDGVTLQDLVARTGVSEVALLKLDLEGAEYDLLGDATAADLEPFEQVFVEFHHHAVPDRTKRDTQAIVARLEQTGMVSFSLDDHNILFYRT